MTIYAECIKLLSERLHYRAPFSNVVMVATLRGDLTAGRLEAALKKTILRHPLMNASIQMDEAGNAWFMLNKNNLELDLTVLTREGAGHWRQRFLEEETRLFSLSTGPLARFVLLQGNGRADLMMIWHHTLCDGVSASYLLRDILSFLADPGREAVPLPVKIIGSEKDLPAAPPKGTPALIAKYLNRAWNKKKTVFDETQYREMADGYWMSRETAILTGSLPSDLLRELRARCRSEGVTVNSAVLTAFAEARRTVQGDTSARANKTGMAINIRDSLNQNPGEGIGNFAAGFSLIYKYDRGKTFWGNARRLHKIVSHSLSSDKKVFLFLQFLISLEPTLLDAVYFNLYTGYQNKTAAQLANILGFGEKRQGLGVTNIGQVDLAERYGSYSLEQVFLIPPHWPNSENFCGVVTAAGAMNLVLLHRKADDRSDRIMEQVMGRVIELLQRSAQDDSFKEEK